jgi:asparaginyl-tRNA synthetase
LQIVCKTESTKNYDSIAKIRTGSSIIANGSVKINDKTSNGIELITDEIILLKQAHEDYPLQKKQHSLEFLRDIAHLRPRTTTIGAIMHVRSNLAFAIHKFFNENDFM